MMGKFDKRETASQVFGFSQDQKTGHCIATIRDLGSFEFEGEDAPHVVHRLRQAANAIEQQTSEEPAAEVLDRQYKAAINRANGTPAQTAERRAAKKAVRTEKAAKKETSADRKARARASKR